MNLALLCAAGAAHAQVSGQDAATAQALFEDGKRLMAQGKHAEACPKLVESQRLDPGGGTLFAIALCHEGEGKTATAWADFNGALSEARKDKRADRETAALERIRAIEPKLTRVRILPAAKVEGLEVKRDGAKVGDVQWGTPLPIDPGPHTFEASAPGKMPWRDTVDVRGEGATVDVVVPALADAPIAPAPAPAPVPRSEPTKPLPPPSPEEGSSQKTWAVIAGAAGVVATGIGLGFGLSASSTWSDVETSCPGGKCTDPKKIEDGKDAGSAADVSTVLVSVGAVGIVAGVVLWLTAPSNESRRATRSVPVVTGRGVGFTFGGL